MSSDYQSSVWKNNYTLNDYHICDSPIIQVRPSEERNNLYVFSRDGYVYHVDGYDFKVLDSHQVSKNKLCCVEEVSVLATRGFLVADDGGGLTLFDSSFDEGKDFGKRSSFVTAIQCIGRGRLLISYPLGEDKVRVEMISSTDGRNITQIDTENIKRVRDFHCPAARWNKNDGWVVAASDNAVVTIDFKMYQLSQRSLVGIRPEFFIDEIACDISRQKLAGKDIEDTQGYFQLSDVEQKKSTISWDHDTQVFTEDNRLYVKNFREANELVTLEKEDVVLKNLHEPKGRICCGTIDGRLIVSDWRLFSHRFIVD